MTADPLAGRSKLLIVFVPAFNEAGRIEQTIGDILAQSGVLSEAGCELRIYVVDDGSTDGTRELARSAGAHRVIRHRVNLGLGAAVRSGLLAARADGADIVAKLDADLQHDPADLKALITPLIDDEADLVYGDRFKRIDYRMPWVRRAGNAIFTTLMRWLTGWPLRDSQPGIFAANKAYLQNFYLPGDYNATQQVLLDAYHRGLRFAHVPVAFRRRSGGRSFVSLRYPLKVIPQIALVLVSVKPMRIFASIGLVFMGTASVVFCWQFAQWLAGHAPKPVVSVNFVLGTGLFGLQTFFFGVLAELIVRRPKQP